MLARTNGISEKMQYIIKSIYNPNASNQEIELLYNSNKELINKLAASKLRIPKNAEGPFNIANEPTPEAIASTIQGAYVASQTGQKLSAGYPFRTWHVVTHRKNYRPPSASGNLQWIYVAESQGVEIHVHILVETTYGVIDTEVLRMLNLFPVLANDKTSIQPVYKSLDDAIEYLRSQAISVYENGIRPFHRIWVDGTNHRPSKLRFASSEGEVPSYIGDSYSYQKYKQWYENFPNRPHNIHNVNNLSAALSLANELKKNVYGQSPFIYNTQTVIAFGNLKAIHKDYPPPYYKGQPIVIILHSSIEELKQMKWLNVVPEVIYVP